MENHQSLYSCLFSAVLNRTLPLLLLDALLPLFLLTSLHCLLSPLPSLSLSLPSLFCPLSSTLSLLTSPYIHQGVLAFWRGNGVNVLRIIPNAAIKFSCNDAYKQMLAPPGSDPRSLPIAYKVN